MYLHDALGLSVMTVRRMSQYSSTSPHRRQEEGKETAPAVPVSFFFFFLWTYKVSQKFLPPADFLLFLWKSESLALIPHFPVVLLKLTPLLWLHGGFTPLLWTWWTTDLGFGHTTCFGQWNVRGCDVSRSLKCAFTVELVLLSLHNSPREEHTPGSL